MAASSIQAGKLRRRFQVWLPPDPNVGTRDPLGQPSGAYTLAGTISGSLRALSGREVWQAQQVQADATHEFVTRWSSLVAGLTAAGRIVDAVTGDTFELSSVNDPDGRRRMISGYAVKVADLSPWLLDENGDGILDENGSPIGAGIAA